MFKASRNPTKQDNSRWQIVLYGILGTITFWIGSGVVSAVMTGEASGRRGREFLRSDDPMMYWINVGVDVCIVAICLVSVVWIAMYDAKRAVGRPGSAKVPE